VTKTTRPGRRQALFRKEQRHEFRYRLSIVLAEFFSWVFWLIPRPLRYFLADRIGDLFRVNTNTYRDNVIANISQVLGDSANEQRIHSAVVSIFRTSARNFTDLITMPRERRAELIRRLAVTRGSWEQVDEAVALGKGVILVAGHLGCFDFVGQAFWARGYKLTIVTGRTTSRFIFDGVTHLRGSRGSRMVEPTPSGVRQVIRALRQGECAVFVADRDFFQNGRDVTFFGRRTTLPPGPVRIARDTGATVIPIMPRRTPRGHEIQILEGFTVPKTGDLEADMDQGFARLIDALEYGIRGSVDQWVMFQRVWPETPPPAVRVFPIGSPLESELLEKVAQRLPELPIGDRAPHLPIRRGKTEERPAELGPDAGGPEKTTDS
jgi:KDO2-lipid IV(A) lauroyltransferase